MVFFHILMVLYHLFTHLRGFDLAWFDHLFLVCIVFFVVVDTT